MLRSNALWWCVVAGLFCLSPSAMWAQEQPAEATMVRFAMVLTDVKEGPTLPQARPLDEANDAGLVEALRGTGLVPTAIVAEAWLRVDPQMQSSSRGIVGRLEWLGVFTVEHSFVVPYSQHTKFKLIADDAPSVSSLRVALSVPVPAHNNPNQEPSWLDMSIERLDWSPSSQPEFLGALPNPMGSTLAVVAVPVGWKPQVQAAP